MSSDLCQTCGASWECEHREPPKKIEIKQRSGPPVLMVVSGPAGMSKPELRRLLMESITAKPGQDAKQLSKALGHDVTNTWANTSNDPILKGIHEMLNAMKRDRMIIDYAFGQWIPYTVAAHRAILQQDIESTEPYLRQEEAQLARKRSRLDAKKRELARLTDDEVSP